MKKSDYQNFEFLKQSVSQIANQSHRVAEVPDFCTSLNKERLEVGHILSS